LKVKAFRIPRQVVIPGLVVTVRERPVNHEDLDGAKAIWDYDPEGRAVITIREDLPIEKKRYLLLHELQHLTIDYLAMAIDPDQKHSKHFRVC
jgi:Zn-dependent peptidase ImmA (M78 family)